MTNVDEVEDLWLYASHHEAAHATVAAIYGMPIDNLTLSVAATRRGPVPEGGLYLPDGYDDEDDEELAQHIVLSLAGPEAHAWAMHTYHGVRVAKARPVADSYAGGDYRNVDTYLGCMSQVSNRLVRQLEAEASGMVSDLWHSICAVAEALRDNDGYLSGSDIYSIV